ncbi:MAG: pilus assembly protein [Oscillospiraceae bacterium]|nr:pilus assembly protein [Oscillospiraceae bacterium]
MKQYKHLWEDTRGYAVVEATILFPIIFMIFAGLVLLAMYLPTRMVLQQATQYAANAMATEQSDTWLDFNEQQMEYQWETNRVFLPNVYVALFQSFFKGNAQEQAETIVTKIEENGLVAHVGELTVECEVVNYIIYKEIIVTATRTIPMPVDLSFVKFPTEIPITVTSVAVVQNGDEFVRNIDLAAEFLVYLDEEYGLGFGNLSEWLEKAWDFLGV